MASDRGSARAGEPARANAALRARMVSTLENLERDMGDSFWPAAVPPPPWLEEEPSDGGQGTEELGAALSKSCGPPGRVDMSTADADTSDLMSRHASSSEIPSPIAIFPGFFPGIRLAPVCHRSPNNLRK